MKDLPPRESFDAPVQDTEFNWKRVEVYEDFLDGEINDPIEQADDPWNGYVSLAEMAKILGIKKQSLQVRIIRSNNEIFDNRYYRNVVGEVGRRSERMLSPDQQEALTGPIDVIPAGFVTIEEFSTRIGVIKYTVLGWASNQGDDFGEIKSVGKLKVLSPEQQATLLKLHNREVPEGFKARQDFLSELGITSKGLYDLIDRIGVENFGEVLAIGGRRYFSPAQQKMAWDNVTPLFEEQLIGCKTITEMSEEFGVSKSTLRQRIQILREESGDFGDIEQFREQGARGRAAMLISPEQVIQLQKQDREIREKRGRVMLHAAMRDGLS